MKQVVLPQDSPQLFDFLGKSMRPTLRAGMRILVEKISPCQVKRGDIVVYSNQSSLVAHRVIRVAQENGKRVFFLKGDNQAYVDADCIPEDEIIGRVRQAFERNNPNRDCLIHQRTITWLYLVMGNLAFYMRTKRQNIPQWMRNVFKPLVGFFFITLKKIIHLIYTGVQHEHLFFKRIAAGTGNRE